MGLEDGVKGDWVPEKFQHTRVLDKGRYIKYRHVYDGDGQHVGVIVDESPGVDSEEFFSGTWVIWDHSEYKGAETAPEEYGAQMGWAVAETEIAAAGIAKYFVIAMMASVPGIDDAVIVVMANGMRYIRIAGRWVKLQRTKRKGALKEANSAADATDAHRGGEAVSSEEAAKLDQLVAEERERRTYVANPKHGPDAKHGPRGVIGKEPTNGQQVLDNSVRVKSTSDKRIGYDPVTGEIVVFQPDNDGGWHGYVVPFQHLHNEEKRAITRSGRKLKDGKAVDCIQ